MMERSESMPEKIWDSFKEIGCEPEVVEKGRIGCVRLRGDAVPLDLYFHTRPGLSLLQLIIPVPVQVPDGSRVKAAELIARANCSWPLGHLELKMSTGLLVWRASIPIEDGTITSCQIRHLLSAGMGMVLTYLPAINRLIYGDDLSPAEAIAEVEMAELQAANPKKTS